MIDVLVTHPKDIYYPIWVSRMNQDRELFARIIVVMTQQATELDFTHNIENDIRGVTVIKEYPDDGKDWRNAAINHGLKYLHPKSRSVLFLEQDFIVEDHFFEHLLGQRKDYQAIGFMDGNRFHPACLWVTRTLLTVTSRDFSVDKDVGDHFVKFSREVMELGTWTTLEELNLPGWKHLSGLSQNYRLTNNYHKPEEFKQYNQNCLQYPMPDDWRKLLEQGMV